ncbi:forkhead box N4-like [Brachionus plicatilis]|uniref:Forkhead box N4-like n=1 Tax=Brachionus plicatilis TaxID=10195 RepID=A0A3M7SDS5_BRAPC|nr:forkhead box N4-like [Brachionus plicatilis]
MNMDLMIDCIPSFGDKLSEMLEDDLKALYTSSSSSPSFDDDQFPGSNFFDDLMLSSCNQSSLNLDPLSSTLNNLDDTYNSIINSSSLNTSHCSYQSSPVSSASISTVSSSAPSPLSLSASSSSLAAALANYQTSSNCSSNQSSPICLSPNQFNNYSLDDFTLNTNSPGRNPTQSKYIHDNFSSNNYSLYSVVNPMDINRNYAAENSANQSQMASAKGLQGVQLSTSVINASRVDQGSIGKTNFDLNENQQNKRCKFSHNLSTFSMVKQEPINSDGESSHSNESDSNSNFSNSSMANSTYKNSEYQPKKVIIATKFEPLFNINTPGTQMANAQAGSNGSILLNNSQISVIKIPKENLEAKSLQLPISLPMGAKTDNSPNTKTIIQYKQLINGNTSQTIKQIKNRQNSTSSQNNANNQNGCVTQVALRSDGKAYPKPPYSYSCLIAMALRNSDSGTLPVSDIYEFIIENFPYYKTARDGWKNSIRHNLSLNKCFEKIENPTNGSKKGCLWALNPEKCKKLEEECKRCRQRDPVNIRLSMSRPDDLNKIERGEQRVKKYTCQRKLLENQQIGTASNTNTQQSPTAQQSNNQFYDKNFILDLNTNIKDEELEYISADINIDPSILSTVNQTIRSNIQ